MVYNFLFWKYLPAAQDSRKYPQKHLKTLIKFFLVISSVISFLLFQSCHSRPVISGTIPVKFRHSSILIDNKWRRNEGIALY